MKPDPRQEHAEVCRQIAQFFDMHNKGANYTPRDLFNVANLMTRELHLRLLIERLLIEKDEDKNNA